MTNEKSLPTVTSMNELAYDSDVRRSVIALENSIRLIMSDGEYVSADGVSRYRFNYSEGVGLRRVSGML